MDDIATKPDITAAELAVDRHVEHGNVSYPIVDLELGPDGAYVLGS